MKQILTLALLFHFSINIFSQTFSCGDTLIDPRDGKKYATVLIGSDCWFKQNLNYGTYVQSDSMGTIHSQQLNNGTPEKYAQNNDTTNLNIYGGLYEQSELMNYSTTPQGLCPNGWHVSNNQEWQNLIIAAGGNMITPNAGNQGNGLKAIGQGFGSGTGTDLVGISLLHGGDRDGFGIFYGLGLRSIYWTSTSSGPGQAYHYTLWAENDTIERYSLGTQTTAFSCRCVKDNSTGVENNIIHDKIEIFPNPSSIFININNINFNGNIKIYNSIGILVESLNVSDQNYSIKINTSEWQIGLYLIEFIDSEEHLISYKKIIVGQNSN